MRYYVVENEKPVGPYEVDQLVARGLKGDDLVWCDGMADWKRADSIEEIRCALGGAMPPVPPVDYSSACQAEGSRPPVPGQGRGVDSVYALLLSALRYRGYREGLQCQQPLECRPLR